MARSRRRSGETRWLCRWLRIVRRLQPPQRRRRGHPDVYSSAAMVQAFFVMTVKKIKRFQGLYNYLANNDPIRCACGFQDGLPHRRTFTRRFRRLADELGAWMRRAVQRAIAEGYITAAVAARAIAHATRTASCTPNRRNRCDGTPRGRGTWAHANAVRSPVGYP